MEYYFPIQGILWNIIPKKCDLFPILISKHCMHSTQKLFKNCMFWCKKGLWARGQRVLVKRRSVALNCADIIRSKKTLYPYQCALMHSILRYFYVLNVLNLVERSLNQDRVGYFWQFWHVFLRWVHMISSKYLHWNHSFQNGQL